MPATSLGPAKQLQTVCLCISSGEPAEVEVRLDRYLLVAGLGGPPLDVKIPDHQHWRRCVVAVRPT